MAFLLLVNITNHINIQVMNHYNIFFGSLKQLRLNENCEF